MFNRLKIDFLSNHNQASRVLQMERNSLEHLLLHFCGVTAKKEYGSIYSDLPCIYNGIFFSLIKSCLFF